MCILLARTSKLFQPLPSPGSEATLTALWVRYGSASVSVPVSAPVHLGRGHKLPLTGQFQQETSAGWEVQGQTQRPGELIPGSQGPSSGCVVTRQNE